MLPVAKVRHTSPHRARISLKNVVATQKDLFEVAERLLECQGVASAKVYPATKSLVLNFTGNVGDISAFTERSGLFTFGWEAPKEVRERWQSSSSVERPSARLTAAWMEVLRTADRRLLELSMGNVDLASLAFVSCLGLAGWQATRKSFLPAGLTLISLSFAFLAMKPERSGERMFSDRSVPDSPKPSRSVAQA